ncbi:MAG: hypothetical protein KGI58_01130 [Patescibacteria group bacterium]|nr:hypothetical protein [Patescibacteria group bacterium]
MKTLLQSYKLHFTNKRFIISLIIGLALLVISLVINFYAGMYATESAGNPVPDIILSNIRVYDVDAIFIYGPVVFWSFVLLVCLLKPQKLPFTLKSIALFTIIRSVFVSLTHIGPFPTQVVMDTTSHLMQNFIFGGDLFFSGHTGLPFLMALLFWNNTFLRWLFVASSVMFGVVVLLAHLHYSIDVLAAFFITYTIYKIAIVFFRKDHELFLSE